MLIQVLKSKIHNATITDVELEYEGSIMIDEELYTAAKMHTYEKVLIVDLNNGQRFETYIIKGKKGGRGISVNGAASRLVYKGDKIIIMSFTSIEEDKAADHQPAIIRLDNKNQIIK